MVDRPLQQPLGLLLRRQISDFFDFVVRKLGWRSRLWLALLQLHAEGKFVPSRPNRRGNGRCNEDQNHGQAEDRHQAFGSAWLDSGGGVLRRDGWRIGSGLAAHQVFCSIWSLST